MSFSLVTAPNGVVFLRSSLIGCPHGFAARLGGVSTQPHTSALNLAFGRGDEDAVVLENLRRFSDAVGIAPESVISLPQIHSRIVIDADESMGGEGYFRQTDRSCDGYVTDRPDITLGVKTADCVPILFHDPEAGVIGAVHAGWRGTAADIVGVCIDKMCAKGAHPDSIRAAIGAAIHFCCYEVGGDFYESVCKLAGSELAKRFIRRTESGQLHADIVGMNEHLLLSHGLSKEHIDKSDFCTCCHPELFYSHRFSHGVRGTMLSVIAL